MKHLLKFNNLMILFALSSITFNVLNGQNIKQTLSKQIHQFEIGKRYLKLGNTYREGSNFEFAKRYLEKGLNIVKRYGGYWEAVGYEFIGHYYRDIKKPKRALYFLLKAKSIYGKIIKQEDGSQVAIEESINLINGNEIVNDPDAFSKSSEIEKLKYENKRLLEENKRLSNNITQLERETNSFPQSSQDDQEKASSTYPPGTSPKSGSTQNSIQDSIPKLLLEQKEIVKKKPSLNLKQITIGEGVLPNPNPTIIIKE